jgi:hypothetical protein
MKKARLNRRSLQKLVEEVECLDLIGRDIDDNNHSIFVDDYKNYLKDSLLEGTTTHDVKKYLSNDIRDQYIMAKAFVSQYNKVKKKLLALSIKSQEKV